MTEFNPALPQPNIPDWTNAPGRLIDGSGLGEIFGKLATNVAEVYGNEKKKAVTNELYDSADKAAEEGRIESLSKAAGVPPDLARSMGRAELYEKAFKSGNFSEAQFYTKMDVWAKEAKTRYPQYRDLIDQQTERVMGRTPANAELDAVRKQYEDELTSRSESEKALTTFISQHAEFLTPDEVIQIQTGNSEVRNRLKTKAMILKGDNERFKTEMQMLDSKAKAGALEAGPVLSQGVSNLERKFYLGAVEQGGGSIQGLRAEIRKMAEGGFTPEETARAAQLVQEAKDALDQGWAALTTTPGENGKALLDYFANDPTALNAQKQRIEDMKKGLDELRDGKTGFLEWNATMEAAAVNGRAQKLKEQMGADAYEGYKSIVDLVGQDQANLMYGNIALNNGDPIADMMTQLVFGKAMKDGNIGKAVTEVNAAADPSLTSALNVGTRAAVEATIKTAVDPNMPREARAKALDAVLGDTENAFLRKLKDTPDNTGLSSREKYFKRMTMPEIAATAKELGKEKEYTEWVKRSAVALYAGTVEQVNATNTSTKYVDITFNPNTMLFEARLNPTLVKDPKRVTDYVNQRRAGKAYTSAAPTWKRPAPRDIPIQDLDSIKAGMDAVQKLNMINGALVEALKAEKPGIKGEDLAKELEQYMGDLKSSYDKEEPWQVRAMKAIGEALTTPWEEGKPSKNSAGEDFGVVPQGDTSFNVNESSLGDEDAAAILGFVSHAEGADYNTLFGGKQTDLEGMTVAEVQNLQRSHGKKTGSSATGAYQVMRRTLSELIDAGVVDPDELFTQDVQDRIGMALLQRRGYEDWKAGKLSTEQFASRLALEWASLPTVTSKSAHSGVMNNKATKSRGELISMLDSVKG